jgi:hypothetical protein
MRFPEIHYPKFNPDIPAILQLSPLYKYNVPTGEGSAATSREADYATPLIKKLLETFGKPGDKMAVLTGAQGKNTAIDKIMDRLKSILSHRKGTATEREMGLTCEKCNSKKIKKKCDNCKGSGTEQDSEGNERPCEICRGSGYARRMICPACDLHICPECGKKMTPKGQDLWCPTHGYLDINESINTMNEMIIECAERILKTYNAMLTEAVVNGELTITEYQEMVVDMI